MLTASEGRSIKNCPRQETHFCCQPYSFFKTYIWDKDNASHSHNDRHPTKLTVSKSPLPSKTGSLEGRKSEQLCSSSFLLDSDENTTQMCSNEPFVGEQQQHTRVPADLKKLSRMSNDIKSDTCWPVSAERAKIKHTETGGPVATSLTSHLSPLWARAA